MSRFCWWLVDRLSRTLDPGERDAVLGDIAESGESGGEALRDLLDLAARRQAALWSEPRPWLTLGGLIVPVGMFVRGLSLNSWLESVTVQVMTLARQGVLEQSGMTPADEIVRLACGFLLIASWAGTGGLVLGSVLRRSAWIYAAFVCGVWWLGFAMPLRMLFQIPLRQRLVWMNVVWLSVQIVVIVIPFLWGVRRGARFGPPGGGLTVLLAAAIAAMTVVMQVEDSRQALAYEVWRNGGSLGWQLAWTPRLLPFLAIFWQLGMLTSAKWRSPLIKEKNI